MLTPLSAQTRVAGHHSTVCSAPGLRPSMVKREGLRSAVHLLFDAVTFRTVLYVQRRHCGPCTCATQTCQCLAC